MISSQHRAIFLDSSLITCVELQPILTMHSVQPKTLFLSMSMLVGVCECGGVEQVCREKVYSNACTQTCLGCASGLEGSVDCDVGYSDGIDQTRDVGGPPNGPSGGWWCRDNHNYSSTSCSAGGNSSVGKCCYPGYRCSGDLLKYYKDCSYVGDNKYISSVGNSKETCTYDCWDPPAIKPSGWSGSYTPNKYDSKCHKCATDSDCQCTGDDAGKTPKCGTLANGFRDCKCEKSGGKF